MKIAHIITGLNAGGAERALLDLLQAGLAESHDNFVISLQTSGSIGPAIRDLGIPAVALNLHGPRNLVSAVAKFSRIIADISPDVVHGIMYHGAIFAVLAKYVSGRDAALVWSIHHGLYDIASERPLTRGVIRLNRLVSSRPDAIVYCAQLAKAQHEGFGFESRRSTTIPNGIDLKRLAPDRALRNQVRQELGLANDTIVIGHVARLHPVKNHQGFLRCAVKLADKYPKVGFLLCGKGVSFENEILRAIVPSRLDEKFRLLGERDDVHRLMCAMDGFCLSSRDGEASPVVLGEAMAHEVPCVTTDVGDSALIVGDSGFVVSPTDESALLSALESLVTMSDEQRHARGHAAREKIAAEYDIRRTVSAYSAVFERVAIPERSTL